MKKAQKRSPKSGRALSARDFGFGEAMTYSKRKGGPTYFHRFGPRVRVGVLGRYLVIGPVAVRAGQLHG